MNKKQTKGFTIIEVVLVLAIAGLIFLMVFIALPAMQRGQRDDARKRDVELIATAVTTFTGNNRGAWPSTEQLKGYLDKLSGNVVRENVSIQAYTASVQPESGYAVVVTGSSCGDSTNTNQQLSKATARQFAVVTKLEVGGGQYFCQDS